MKDINNRVREYNGWPELKAVLDKSDFVFIFGAFIRGLHVMRHLEGHGYNVGFIDNDKSKQKGGYEDYEVKSLEFAIENSSENTVFLIPENRHKQEMRKSLQELGIKNEKIIDVFKTLIPYKSLSLEVQIVEHCNLGCKNCNHFSPLAEKEFISVEELKKDFQRISKLCEKQALRRLFLLGGEPLLHPKLGVICDTSREVFPNTPITIITNGLLIRNITSDIWDKCIENNIIVRVTRYPISFDYENAIKMLRKFGVKTEESSIVSDFIKMPLDINGKDYYENFKNCFTGTECILLSHGKLYPCAYPANIKWLNRVSINSFLLSEYDGVNIYEHNELDEIMEEIAKPMPFCKYCAYSKGELSEEWKPYDGSMKCWRV